jgi:uncharacterized protein (DUF58 family)
VSTLEEGTREKGKLRRFLKPEVLAKIRRLDLIARLVVEGFVTGLHQSPFHGYSIEFAEHREYSPGDDIKHVDWKVFGRTDRYYIKQYEEETNLQAYVCLDASESMAYKSPGSAVSKLEYGSYVAAALSYLILNQRDTIGLCTFDQEVRDFLPASQQPSHLKLILHQLDQLEPKGTSKIGRVLEGLAERVRKRGLYIIITDLLDDPTDLLLGLRHLRYQRNEVILFHVMDHQELNFEFQDMLKLEGLEGLGEELIDPVAIKKSYLKELNGFLETVRMGCRANKVDYVLMDTSKPLDVALVRYLATRSEVKLK